MYPHPRGGRGIGEAGMGGTADLMSHHHDPNAVGSSGDRDWPSPSLSRPQPGRGMGLAHSARQNHTHTRKVTVTSAAWMPSLRSLGGLTHPTEPGATDGASYTEAARMKGVAVGTMYDTASQAPGGIHSSFPKAADFSAAAHHTTAGAEATGIGGDSYLPSAPYQEMMANFGRDYAMIERPQSSIATNRKPAELPFPQQGLPEVPACQAIEPAIPPSRLGRRILTQKPVRHPDFVRAKFTGQSGKATSLDYTLVECTACQETLEIPKSAVVLSCPACDQVTPVASCRIVRV